MTPPLISIITVTFNNVIGFEKTLSSLKYLDSISYELIVIDGGSTDTSLEIIKNNQEKITQWISEKDSGIYDAMNKGVNLASAPWLIFMNAGDCFSNEIDCKLVERALASGADFVYGSNLIQYGFNWTRLNVPSQISNFWQSLPFSHQSIFSKRKYHLERQFNLEYPICADYEFYAYFFSRDFTFIELPTVVSVTEAGGRSEFNRHRIALEVKSISGYYFPNYKNTFYFFFYPLKEWFVELIKSIMPERLKNQFIKFKYLIS